jgi:hypothetical protein
VSSTMCSRFIAAAPTIARICSVVQAPPHDQDGAGSRVLLATSQGMRRGRVVH